MVTSITPIIQQYTPRAQVRVGDRRAYVTLEPDAYLDSTTSATQLAMQTHASPNVAITNGTDSYHRNHQYSITAVTTSTGSIAERYAYSAYGQPTILDASASVLSSSAINNRYTYTGREWDATLGLHHFRARWMSPSAGRFLSRDPIGFEGNAWDLYEFVRGRSLGYLDPSGTLQVSGGTSNPVGPRTPVSRPRLHPMNRGRVAIDFDANATKRCIFYADPFPGIAGIDDIPTNGGVKIPFTTQDDAIRIIKSSGCCEVIFAGHQGGSDSNGNPGGVEGMINCNPPDDFGVKLKDAFRLNGCNVTCSLILAACGNAVPGSSSAPDDCRQKLANDSGCEVFGSPNTIIYYDPTNSYPSQRNCNLDYKSKGKSCNGTWSNWWRVIKYEPWPFNRYLPMD